MFQSITKDGWAYIMYNLIDSGQGPMAIVFFSLLIVLGSFFLLNLVLAVVMQAFTNIQLKEIELAQER